MSVFKKEDFMQFIKAHSMSLGIPERETWSRTPVWTLRPLVAITHQYISASLSLSKVMVTLKTPASLSSVMKTMSLSRFLGVFTTILHSPYTGPLHQYLECSLNWRSYQQETVTDPPDDAFISLGAVSWAESTRCFISHMRQRAGAENTQKHLYKCDAQTFEELQSFSK